MDTGAEKIFTYESLAELGETYHRVAELIANTALPRELYISEITNDRETGIGIKPAPMNVAMNGLKVIFELQRMAVRTSRVQVNRHNRQIVSHLLGSGILEVTECLGKERFTPVALDSLRKPLAIINDRLLESFPHSTDMLVVSDYESRESFWYARNVLSRHTG